MIVLCQCDAWGKVTNRVINNATVNSKNNFLYKGYYYDEETGWYYLNTRYYDPTTARFINADNVNYLDTDSVESVSLFAYCNNNPVMYFDLNGTGPDWWHWVVSSAMVIGGIALFFVPGMQLAGGALIGAGVGSMLGGYIGESYGYDFDSSYALGMGVGALLGVGVAYAAPFIGQFMSSSWSFGTQALISSAGQMMLTGGITLTGTQISISAGALALGGYMLFAKDNFVEYLKKGMSQNQKEKFQREIESLKKKEGRGGSDNLDRDILREIAQWIKKIFS